MMYLAMYADVAPGSSLMMSLMLTGEGCVKRVLIDNKERYPLLVYLLYGDWKEIKYL